MENGGDKKLYLVAKRRARREVYRAKSAAQRTLLDCLNAANGRDNVFRVVKQMKRENRDIVGEQCVRDDVGRVVVGGVDLGRHGAHIITDCQISSLIAIRRLWSQLLRSVDRGTLVSGDMLQRDIKAVRL